MAKKKYTLLLDSDVVEAARERYDNLSETVTQLLRRLVAETQAKQILQSLKEYEKESKEQRQKQGIFSDNHRKFL